ncbi:hypothetical protein PJE062_707 [Pseudovibrio sp. JE062]|nr:hypothetical protein PJE062_707 [Pseudovibrio sp. JE062]
MCILFEIAPNLVFFPEFLALMHDDGTTTDSSIGVWPHLADARAPLKLL